MAGDEAAESKEVALAFTKALTARDYATAYALTAMEYRGATAMQAMQAAFEGVVPSDWGSVGPIEVVQTMQDWPGRKTADIGWVYVSIGGDVYSEAVTIVVTREGGVARVRTAEFGRP